MADLPALLAALEHDPDDAQALSGLIEAARHAPPDLRASRFASARKALGGRGRPDTVVQLLDVELASNPDLERKIDLLLEKGMVLDGELLDVPAARIVFEEVRALRPDDTMAAEAIGELDVSASNWRKFADKYVSEAGASTDRSLATGLYVSAAECFVRFEPGAPEAEHYLRKALEIDPRGSKAAFHLARLLRRAGRWADLAKLLADRGEQAASVEERVAALLGVADVARHRIDDPARADAAIRRVLQLDPAQPQALRAVAEAQMAAADWPGLVATYHAALKARRDDDLGMVLQIAMVTWKHIGDLDRAEEYFRRVRKLDPAHPAAIDFYREYYPAKGENAKLLALLRQVEKSPRARSDSSGAARPIAVEIATLAEQQNNPEKAIEAWKQHLRAEPSSQDARTALARLYRRTDKWNALLDLMKDEMERLPEGDVAGRVGKLHDIVEIYRDKLRLDVMVINTYNAILKIDPENRRASDELAAKYRALGRWNDLIAILTRKSEGPGLEDAERIALLREIAELWAERFGNFANAIKPLERIVELSPGDPGAVARLKEIYTKRRQWRALIDVLGREASVLEGADRRAKQSEMARLAAERLGDMRLAIEIHNAVLAESGPAADTLAALAGLYEREKRYLALAEILHQQRASAGLTGKEQIALCEKLGQIYADRLHAPKQAAAAWQDILEIEPGHAKALRTLRELYANAGDFAGLERLYARLGQQEELVDALLGIADRLEAKAARLPLIERAAQLAQQRADAAAEAAAQASAQTGGPTTKDTVATQALERARQVWERVLAVDPQHTAAASALAPIYARQEKWARLITVLEIELAAARDDQARLAKIAEIRQLCEQKLASRTLAFTWTLRAFELDPASDALYADVLRLANEPDQWHEVAAAFERQLAPGSKLSPAQQLKLVRELARIASRRLGDPERARGYHRQIIALAPDDREAEQHLEELAIQLHDWPELLASYRRRAAREKDATERASLLIEIASLQEEKLVDLDGAAATYHEALSAMPGQLRALRALARIEEARGDWDSLVDVLAQELAQTPAAPGQLGQSGQARFDLLMRLGNLEELSLERPGRALGHYREALGVAPAGNARTTAVASIVRLILPPAVPLAGPTADSVPARRDARWGESAGSAGREGTGTSPEINEAVFPAERISAARLILPHLEGAGAVAQEASALEVIRAGEATSPTEKLELDRRLMRRYRGELADPAAAWTAGLRVIAADPGDNEVRVALGELAGELGRDGEWARVLSNALVALQTDGAPTKLRAVATELARLAGERLGDLPTAERAWQVVLDVEHDAPDAFEALIGMFRGAERWLDLRALLERRVEVIRDPRHRLAVLLEIAVLEEDLLQRSSEAIAVHRRVLELDPSYLASYHALDRLYASAGEWDALEELLARQIHVVTAPRDRIELGYRRAELFAHRLDEPMRAVDLLEEVIARQRSHADARELLEELLGKAAAPEITMRVARLLEPLYEQDKLWKDLVGVLRAQRRLASGTEAVELLSRIAAIEEAELSAPRNAFDAWIEVLALDPTHERARVELARLARQLARWPEATAAFETAVTAAPHGDVVTRGSLLGELASYYDTEVGDAPKAIAAYRRLIETDPSNPLTIRRAAFALARLYEDAQSWPELRAIVRKQAEWAEDPNERRALLARVAELEEQQLGDRHAAIATWRDVLADQPTDPSALAALERLYHAGEAWRDLIDILRRKLDHADDAAAIGELARIAEIHEVMLEETDEAIAAHLEILDRDPSDRRALDELARLYREAQRHADLLDVLERQAQLEDEPDARIERQVEIARLLAGPLARPVESLERWSTVLDEDPEHPVALGAVEAALGDPDLRMAGAQILRPVYDATKQYERLAQLQLRTADWADDPNSKLRAYAEVVRLREHRLGDLPGAFEVQLLALSHAATEPELGLVVNETDRLAGELGREADLIDAYRAIAPNVLDAEIQRRLYLDVADLSRAVRKDLPLAGEYYQKVLDATPDDRRALVALEAIYRDTNDDVRLTEILLRQADSVNADVDERVGALVEAAGLYVSLDRPDDAIATWEQVLAVAPERRDAVAALEALYREQGRWPDVVELYERRLGFATSIEEAVALRVQLGEIHERYLQDVETAIDNYAAALSGDARHAVALAAVERYLLDPDVRAVAAEVLEPIYVGQHRWLDLIRVYEAKLASASDPRERLKLTRFVARLYEEQLEDFENASRWYAKLFHEQPSDQAIRDQLQRLGSIVDNWAFVAQTYQEYLDREEGDSSDLRDVAIAAATIYDRRLGEVDLAFRAYRRALSIADDGVPDPRELVRRLEELLGRAQKWPELIAIYDDVIAGSDDELRREALIKRARLLEDGIGDVPGAIDGWREVVSVTETAGTEIAEHAYREAVLELERLYRMRGDWRDLGALFESRLARSTEPNEIAELRLKLAELLENQLDDLPGALDQYEQVIGDGHRWEAAVQALERLVVHESHRERIAELLEPVYRDLDWWQKLVVILDAKLDYVRDPADQVRTLHEIARIHEDRGGALDLALQALARAWRIDVADDAGYDSLAKLLVLAGKLAAWDDVVATLEDGAASAGGGELAAELWAKAAEIHEQRRGDMTKAIAAWRKVEEARPDDLAALTALDRLLALERKVDQLVIVVARRADLTEDAGTRLVLLHRVAALYEEVLDDRPAATAAYKNVLAVDDTDLAALDALERLYRISEAPEAARELAQTLERKIELTTDLRERQELRRAAAQVYERDLHDVFQAIGQLTAVLDDDPTEPVALGELDRIYGAQKMWLELLDVIDRRALLAIAAGDRADLSERAAQLVETELRDPDAAIPRYGAVLQLVPAHGAARAALERLLQHDEHAEAITPLLEQVYRAARNAPGLVRVYERRIGISLANGTGDRRADWTALADVHETMGSDPVSAFAVWSRAIEADPDQVELLRPLMRLAEREGLWARLADRLDQLLGEALPPEVEQQYAMQLGQIAEDKLADASRAVTAYERAAAGHEPVPPLVALERVLARANRWAELAGVLRRQADAAESDAQTSEYLFRLGELQERTLGDAGSAVAAYREVLQLTPAHHGSRVALERMLAAAPDQRAAIVDILEPLFEYDGDATRLAGVLEARLDVTDDAVDQAAILSRLVEISENSLGDKRRALDAALRWLAIDPSSREALSEADRLADLLGQWPEVATRLVAIVDARDADLREPDTQVALLCFLGRIQHRHLADLDRAAASYRAALELDPDAANALDELIEILRRRGDQMALAEALRQRGRTTAELGEKRAAFAEVAAIFERAGDRAQAIDAWRELANADDADRGALDELARLYRATGNTRELIETLGQAARLAASPADEKALRIEVAELEPDGARAISAWQQVLDLDPEDLAALSALQSAYARGGDWMSVSDIQNRRLSLAQTPADQVAIHAEIARLAEDKRDSVDDAIAAWYAALDIDRDYLAGYGQLERLLARGERWHDLVELLERLAEVEAARGDTRAEIAALARAADVWEGKLDNPEAAGDILEKILAREPSSVAALTRLSKIYERAGDWDKCKSALEQALQLSPTGRDAADLFYRLGEVARIGDDDAATAIQHFQQALKHDAGHPQAIDALEALARDRRDTELLADMLQRRAAHVQTAADRVALLVELAELERRASRPDAALAALARAANDAPSDARVLGPLADLYFMTGRLDEAAPIYDRLADDARAGRRMKDVARFRQRQGGILEARGDRGGALAAYEEALRVNPTDVSTMTGLGRLYFAAEDWEKARKIYQSLVLQNVDAESGVTKAEVYWALGKIHLQLGQPPKARSMFQRGLELEPQNSKLKEALSSLQ